MLNHSLLFMFPTCRLLILANASSTIGQAVSRMEISSRDAGRIATEEAPPAQR